MSMKSKIEHYKKVYNKDIMDVIPIRDRKQKGYKKTKGEGMGTLDAQFNALLRAMHC
jgi:hypothetical protein